MGGETKTRRSRKPPRARTRTRVSGAWRSTDVYIDYRRGRQVPRTLVGGALGLFTVIAFFGGLAGDSWPIFLVGLATATALAALAIWALIESPIRPHFDQRWKPRRRIDPLDVSGWKALAASLGLELRAKRGLPRIRGSHRGVAFRIAYHQIGGAHTVAIAVLVHSFRAHLEIRPRLAEFGTPHDRATGDADFDREFRAACADVNPVERLLTPEHREAIRAANPELITVAGRTVEARVPGFLTDEDRLRALLDLAVAMART